MLFRAQLWLTLLTLGASANAFAEEYYEFCRSTYCHPYYWLWYPRTPPGLSYGHQVKLNPGGEWINRDGRRVWANQGTRKATVLSHHNPDERNGELAYRTAYSSFIDGREEGTNKIEQVSVGRWVRKITTGDGIVLYKDLAGNVAVRSPDGKWHVTNAQGDYAQTSLDLLQSEIVARAPAPEPRFEARVIHRRVSRAPASLVAPAQAVAAKKKKKKPVKVAVKKVAPAKPAEVPLAPVSEAKPEEKSPPEQQAKTAETKAPEAAADPAKSGFPDLLKESAVPAPKAAAPLAVTSQKPPENPADKK